MNELKPSAPFDVHAANDMIDGFLEPEDRETIGTAALGATLGAGAAVAAGHLMGNEDPDTRDALVIFGGVVGLIAAVLGRGR